MHDTDRTQMESDETYETGELDELDEYEFGELGEEFEAAGEAEYEFEGPLDEVEEMELATELLELQSEAELEEFLGRVFRKVGQKARRFVRSNTGRALGRVLRRVGRRALPVVGGAIGGSVGGPAGAALGSSLARAAGTIFGLELEGLSAEDREFEVARHYVRLAADAAREAAELQETHAPATAARLAAARAARRHAPGLLAPAAANGRPALRRNTPAPYGQRRSGRWVRRGRSIVLLDI